MRYIAVLLTATLSLSCAANAGGIWGEPAEIAPIQTTNTDPLAGQANVTRPPAASSSKTQANVTRPPAASSSKTQANVTRPPAASSSKANGLASDGSAPRQNTVGGITPPHKTAKTDTFVNPPENSAYKIGPLDVLDISVFQVPDLTKSVQVADTGTINLPLVGEIPVEGRTAQEVERDLTSRLGAKYLQNPQVTVFVKDYNSAQVTIDGAVKKPGIYPLKGETSLMQVVAEAGGMDPNSDWTVLVLRQNDGKRSAAKFNVSAIQKGDAQDPPLQAGDRILAGTSKIKTAFNTVLRALPIAGTFMYLP